MKRILMITAFFLMLIPAAKAQILEGDQSISAGFGVGGGYFYGSSTLPTITVNYAKAINEEFSIGPYLAYSSSKQDIGLFVPLEFKYSYLIVGARATYHIDLLDNPDFETYVGAVLGYSFVSVSLEDSSFESSANGNFLTYGVFAGGRYWLNENMGVFAELGLEVSLLTAGLSWRL